MALVCAYFVTSLSITYLLPDINILSLPALIISAAACLPFIIGYAIFSGQLRAKKDGLSSDEVVDKEFSDYLLRDSIDIDVRESGSILTGSTILITGAAGSLGSELLNLTIAFRPKKLILIDQAETPLHDIRLMLKDSGYNHAETIVADIVNERRMEDIISTQKPEYIFHVAAYKHVPMMEDNPRESVENNVQGTRVIADLACKYDVRKFILVSTDKAVNPTSVMGCSKRICEMYVQSLDKAIKDGLVKGCTKYVTTRFGNVLGSNGSVVRLFERQLREGGPLTVTHESISRYFMLVSEACRLVIEAAAMGEGGEIFIFDMGRQVKITDLALRMIEKSGKRDIKIIYTGLRDGEKLMEELLDNNEYCILTPHPKIKIAKVREYDYYDIKDKTESLITLSQTASKEDIVSAMMEIVPEYHSTNEAYIGIKPDLSYMTPARQ